MKVICLFSGGLDSLVLLASLQLRHPCIALNVNYGQRHGREIGACETLCQRLGVPLHKVDLGPVGALLKGGSQTDPTVPVPHGHYAAATMRATVVPNRNMLLLAVAGAVGLAEGCGAVAYAAHKGDHPIYPDCRPEFIAAMQGALALCHYEPLALWTPFMEQTKADIVALGHRLGLPLGDSWSCYEGGSVHCGQCGTCVERREAFRLANVPDPTEYRT